MLSKKAQPGSHDLQGSHLVSNSGIDGDIWPIGEPRRVASLGLTLQRSGAAARICLPADSVQINSVLDRLRCSPNDAASYSTSLKSSKTSGSDPPMMPSSR